MYSLSEHALERVRERLTISPEWVLSLLESSSVEIVCNESSPRRHRVFWSIPDEGAFVAVVNRQTGEVVTVYPALREDLTRMILTDRDPAAGLIHTTFVNWRTTCAAMRLVGITPRVKVQSRAYDQIFVARFMTRNGISKTKQIGRLDRDADIDAVLPSIIAKAVELSSEHGNLGLTIELRNRNDINILQEWVLEETVAYGGKEL